MTTKLNNKQLRERLTMAEKHRAHWKAVMLAWRERWVAAQRGDPRRWYYDKQYRKAANHYEQYCMDCDSLNAQIKQRQIAAKGLVVYDKK